MEAKRLPTLRAQANSQRILLVLQNLARMLIKTRPEVFRKSKHSHKHVNLCQTDDESARAARYLQVSSLPGIRNVILPLTACNGMKVTAPNQLAFGESCTVLHAGHL